MFPFPSPPKKAHPCSPSPLLSRKLTIQTGLSLDILTELVPIMFLTTTCLLAGSICLTNQSPTSIVYWLKLQTIWTNNSPWRDSKRKTQHYGTKKGKRHFTLWNKEGLIKRKCISIQFCQRGKSVYLLLVQTGATLSRNSATICTGVAWTFAWVFP